MVLNKAEREGWEIPTPLPSCIQNKRLREFDPGHACELSDIIRNV